MKNRTYTPGRRATPSRGDAGPAHDAGSLSAPPPTRHTPPRPPRHQHGGHLFPSARPRPRRTPTPMAWTAPQRDGDASHVDDGSGVGRRQVAPPLAAHGAAPRPAVGTTACAASRHPLSSTPRPHHRREFSAVPAATISASGRKRGAGRTQSRHSKQQAQKRGAQCEYRRLSPSVHAALHQRIPPPRYQRRGGTVGGATAPSPRSPS